ncbi:MAG: hypothetical protein ABEJ67_00820 [Halanaeroarchaeum sp.]
MALRTALARTPGAIARNPVLFVPVVVLLVLEIPQFALQYVHPVLAGVVSLFLSGVLVFVMPLFQGGVIGMADEALDGTTSLDRFLEAGRSNYVSLFGASLAVLALNVVFAVAVGVVVVALGAAAYATRPGAGGVAALAVALLLVVLMALAYLVVIVFCQFYGQAIVLEGTGAVDGFRRSVSVVRENPVSVAGYTLLVGTVGAVAGVVFGALSAFASPRTMLVLGLPRPPLGLVVAVGAALLVGGALFGTVVGTLSVAYYRALLDEG